MAQQTPLVSYMTLAQFERRCATVPDLDLGWQYWNWLLPDTAPRYFAWRLLVFLDQWRVFSAGLPSAREAGSVNADPASPDGESKTDSLSGHGRED